MGHSPVRPNKENSSIEDWPVLFGFISIFLSVVTKLCKQSSSDGRRIEGNTVKEAMAREKSPGLKILWLWTIGTAAVMVTTVVKMRLRDMDQLMNAQQEEQLQLQTQHPGGDSVLFDADPVGSGNDADDKF